MQFTEQLNEGLKREYRVTVPSTELDAKLDKLLNDFRANSNIKGFRPGKAPLSLLKQMHGDRARGQVLSEAVEESSRQVLEDNNIRPAAQPELDLEAAPEEGSDLEYTLKVEILPEIDVEGFKAPALERLVVEASDKDIDEAASRVASQQKAYKKAAKTAKAAEGDAVLIDYLGRVDGEAFDGGAAEDFQLVLGSGTFIPGFEDQLIGAKAGEEKQVEVTFPEPYHSKELEGKLAVFDVTVKEVQRETEQKVDDEFAKSLGFEDLAGFRDALKEQIVKEHERVSRSVTKRKLLDILADAYDFAVPATMVDMEFGQIWEQIKREQIMSGEAKEEDFDGMTGPADEAEADEFRAIAERRVRLGLLLSELGTKNNVQVAQDEVNRMIIQEAQRYPGQEQQVFEFYQSNEQARAQLRAPIFEEKVVDFIIEMADVTDKTVSSDELEAAVAALEEDEAPKPAAKKKAPAKKAPAKKAPAKKAAATKTEDTADKPAAAKKKAPAKKAPAKKAADNT